jgi:hypothetical protein
MLQRNTSVNDHKNKLKQFNFNRFANIDLTNSGYIKLLHFILKSEYPLTSYEIEGGTGESKYIHKMLNNLITPSSSCEHLFIWDKVSTSNSKDNENIKKKLYRILNSIYGLDWFRETDKDQYNYITLSSDDKIITLSYATNKKLEIHLLKNKNEEQADEKEGQAILNIYDDKKRFPYLYTANDDKKSYSGFLRTVRKRNGLHVYAETWYNPITKLRYLDVEYVNPKSKKSKKLFSGNFRGFLFYLACELKYGWTQDSKRRIYEVISNPGLTKKVEFLKYWKDFADVGFDVLDILKKIITDFHTIIKQHYRDYSHDYNTYEDDNSPIIGMNARDTSDDNLKLIITERYRWAVLTYFADFENLSPTISPEQYSNYKNSKIESKLNEYNLEMLKNQRYLLSHRLNRIDEEISIGHPLYPLPFL